MFRYFPIALGIATLAAPAIAAEPAHAPATAANARVPDTKYDSAFTGYQPFREQKLAPWRALNDDVHQAGGHIGIFGGAAGARAAAQTAHPPEHKP
jgi:hypothetical protein